MKKIYDVIIIGNGMVGASLACALAPLNWSIAIIDKAPLVTTDQATAIDGRKIALSFGSQQILQHLNVWSALAAQATTIDQVHVSVAGKFGATRIKTTELNIPALGYVLPAMQLTQVLQKQALANKQVTSYFAAELKQIDAANGTVWIEQQNESYELQAKLIIGADGADSASRKLVGIQTDEQDYQHAALVTSVQLARAHQNIAYQRFSEIGTLAVLPMQNNICGIVCTASTTAIETLWQQDDKKLSATLQRHLGYRLGRWQALGSRFKYPLKKIIAQQLARDNFLLLGNAAQNLSPIGAQGFNLALQDLFCLAQELAKNNSITAALQNYLVQRQPEQRRVVELTDRLMRIAGAKNWRSNLVSLGLNLFDLLPSKQTFAEQAAGISPQVKTLLRAHHD